MKWFWCLAAAFRLGAQCLPPEGEFIVARQMAAANPAFAALAPETAMGEAPMAGLRRIFKTGELNRLATSRGLPRADYREVCFEWPLAPVDMERAMAAMRKGLARDGARLELLELSRVPAPPGELIFPVSALRPAGNSLYYWNGFVRYGRDRRLLVPARVRLLIPGTRVAAREALQPGRPLTAEQVEVRHGDFPLEEAGAIDNAAAAVGMNVRHAIAAGTVLRRVDLVEAPLVTAGQTVEVEVRNGATRLLATGQAEQTGRRGDVIAVRNTSSGMRFRARVERVGGVGLVIGPAAGQERN